MGTHRVPSEQLHSNGQHKMLMYYRFRGILEKPIVDILHSFLILNRINMVFDVSGYFKFSLKEVEEEGAGCS